MRSELAVAAVGVATILAVSSVTSTVGDHHHRTNATEPPTAPTCVNYWPEARYRPYGFDHVVHLSSSCTRSAACAVSTNVDPEPVRADVPAGRTTEVITRLGSPVREFTPFVVCRLEPPEPPPPPPLP